MGEVDVLVRGDRFYARGDFMRILVDNPEDLLVLTCPICYEKLEWVPDDPTSFPCDATATADCCGMIYTAYPEKIVVTSHRFDGN